MSPTANAHFVRIAKFKASYSKGQLCLTDITSLSKLLKLFFAQFVAFACKHFLVQAWREMAVVPLYHSDAGAHLYRQRVYIHAMF